VQNLVLKGGLNVANISGDVEDNSEWLVLMLVVEIKVSDNFLCNPELLFSAQGVKFRYSRIGRLRY
jgi:hypothetical protein